MCEDDVLDPAAGVVSGSEWITVEHAELLKISCRARRSHRITIAIDRRVVLRRILVIRAREKTENALPRLRRQHWGDKSLFQDVPLFVDQEKEKRLILDDRSPEAHSILVPVLIIFLDASPVIEPVAGVKGRVAVVPKCASPKLIRAGTRYHLHLARSASDFSVHRRCDDAHFFDKVRTGIRDGKCSVVIAAVGDVEAVSRRVDCAEPPTGKVTGIAGRRPVVGSGAAGGITDTAGCPEQIQYVAAPQWKVAYFLIGKHSPDRGRCCRNECVGRSRHFHRLRHRTHLQ